MNKEQRITDKVKEAVRQRQHNRSVSGAYLSSVHYHHFISVGARGIGYEWNVIALLPSEHQELHSGSPITVNGRQRYTNKEFKTICRNHLMLRYLGWNENKCKFHKGWKEEDYGIERSELWTSGKK